MYGAVGIETLASAPHLELERESNFFQPRRPWLASNSAPTSCAAGSPRRRWVRPPFRRQAMFAPKVHVRGRDDRAASACSCATISKPRVYHVDRWCAATGRARLRDPCRTCSLRNWMLLAGSGIELCCPPAPRPARDTQRLRIIMLNGRGEESDRVRGARNRGDDFRQARSDAGIHSPRPRLSCAAKPQSVANLLRQGPRPRSRQPGVPHGQASALAPRSVCSQIPHAGRPRVFSLDTACDHVWAQSLSTKRTVVMSNHSALRKAIPHPAARGTSSRPCARRLIDHRRLAISGHHAPRAVHTAPC